VICRAVTTTVSVQRGRVTCQAVPPTVSVNLAVVTCQAVITTANVVVLFSAVTALVWIVAFPIVSVTEVDATCPNVRNIAGVTRETAKISEVAKDQTAAVRPMLILVALWTALNQTAFSFRPSSKLQMTPRTCSSPFLVLFMRSF